MDNNLGSPVIALTGSPVQIPVNTIITAPTEAPEYSPQCMIYEHAASNMVTEKEFTTYPVNIAADNWMAIFAGGADKVIKVSYGTTGAHEEFLSITGANSTITFAANSNSYSKDLQVFQFWSYMIIQGDSFIKGLPDIIDSPSDDAIEPNKLNVIIQNS